MTRLRACLFIAIISQESIPGFTVKILSIAADRSEKTVQTQIRLLPNEQSDRGFHCLQLHLYFWTLYRSVNWKLRVCLVSHFF